MRITLLLPVTLAITSPALAATGLMDATLDLFAISPGAKISPRDSTPQNTSTTLQLTPLERYIQRLEAFTFTDEEVNSRSSARLYHVTTPTLPTNITIPDPLLAVDPTSELDELYRISLQAFERERDKPAEEKQAEKEAREKKMTEFGIMNDCFSAFGEQKYCLGGVRELRRLGWEGYAEKFQTLYKELKDKMEEAGRVGLGEKVDAEIREMWRDAQEGGKWNETHNMTGKWDGNWTSSRTSNWTVEGWLKSWVEAQRLTGNRTGYPSFNMTG